MPLDLYIYTARNRKFAPHCNLSTMLIASIYLISFLSAIGCVTLFKLSQLIDPPTRRSLLSFLRKKLIYTLVLQRRTGTSGVNILAFLSILLFLTGNIVVCTYRVDNQNELAKRCGLLFLVNAIPLYLGGRTNLLMDQIFRVPLSDYYLFHRWVGRICVIEGLIHGLVSVRASKPSVLESIVSSSDSAEIHLLRFLSDLPRCCLCWQASLFSPSCSFGGTAMRSF